MMNQIMEQSEQIKAKNMEAGTIREQINNSKNDPTRYLSEDFLQVLNEHRKNCEREGKMDQAMQARRRLKELRILEENKRKNETFERHVSLRED